MQLVIDTSALIAVIANEPEKPRLIEATSGASLLAPASVHWEMGNAFSAMLKRDRITLEEARRALSIYQSIPIRLLEVDLGEALTLAAELNLNAYDAYLIAAARQLRSPLLTLDRALLHSARKAGVPVTEIDT